MTSPYQWPWNVLGVEADADERTVRRAYARLLKQRRPDEDPEAFQRLRYAYESALQMAGAASQPAVTTVAVAASAEEHRQAAAPVEARVKEPSALERAGELWRHFIADPEQLASRRSLKALFESVVNIPTRDELEWQALCHCLQDTTPSEQRIDLCAVLGWRENVAHLRRRDPAIAQAALGRVFADEDYVALRRRFPNAMDLLDNPPNHVVAGARALLRAGVRGEMEQLLILLNRYHQNVVRLRFSHDRLEFWSRCLTYRIGVGRLFGPALVLGAWCGLLFASASMPLNSDRWFGSWAPAQWGILLSSIMLTLVASATITVTFTGRQKLRVQVWRANPWLRYGWIAVWLGAAAASLCDSGSGRTTAAAMAAFGLCTLWATLLYGWPKLKPLAMLTALSSVAFGFATHWIGDDTRAWLMPFAHGVLFAFFFSFAQMECRVILQRRPRIAWACLPVWFAGFAALIVLLLQHDARSTQFAWAIFTFMCAAGGVLGTTRWHDLQMAVPAIFRGYLIWAWVGAAVAKPDIIACVTVALMSAWIVDELKQRRLTQQTAH